MADRVNQVTVADLQLVADAQATLAAAQATMQFVSAHLSKIYELQQGDGIDLKTGEIKRLEAQPFQPPFQPLAAQEAPKAGGPIITP